MKKMQTEVEELRGNVKTMTAQLQQKDAALDAAGSAPADESSKYTILHMVDNPVTRAVEESRKKLAGANGDTSGNAVANGEVSGGTRESNAELLAELEALRRKKDAAEKKHLALGKIFSTQLAEFKEVVTRATGYQINSCGGGIGVNDARPQYKVQSMYAAGEDDYFLFELVKSGNNVTSIEMLGTDFTNQSEWKDAISMYLQRMSSIPGFLSHATIELLSATTRA